MTTQIHGFCDERFAPIREAFEANFADGLEIGASLGVTWRGRLVVDLWGGHADRARSRPWERDTIVMVMSTTKLMMMIAALIVIERGQLDLDARVADYWPEFAQGNKGQVTVREALTHQAGVPGFDVPISDDELCDWDKAIARIAAEPHWFGGKSQICYHWSTYGHLIGELIRRVDGRRPRQFCQEEIFSKVGADFLMGLTPETIARRAELKWPDNSFEGEGILKRLIASTNNATFESPQRLFAEAPSANGFTNGRSIALACAIVANGGLADGERVLAPETIALAGQGQAHGTCPYMGGIRLGIGMGLDSAEFPLPTRTAMGWGGYGGSQGAMDPACGLSMGYAPNNLIIPGPHSEFGVDQRVTRLFWDAFGEVAAALQ